LDQSLLGRPLAEIQDIQAIGRDDPGSAALWDAHLARMYHKAAAAKAVGPDVQAAPQDLYALRFMVLSSMEEGRMVKAQELLEEINRLMQDLQTSQGQFGGGGREGQSGGQQRMEDLADNLRQQQGLSSQTFHEFQNFGQGQDGGAGDGAKELQDDGSFAELQEQLQREVDRQRGNLPGGPGTKPG
jgi:hypothetical protein